MGVVVADVGWGECEAGVGEGGGGGVGCGGVEEGGGGKERVKGRSVGCYVEEEEERREERARVYIVLCVRYRSSHVFLDVSSRLCTLKTSSHVLLLCPNLRLDEGPGLESKIP